MYTITRLLLYFFLRYEWKSDTTVEGPIFYVSTLIFFFVCKNPKCEKDQRDPANTHIHEASLDRKYFETTGEFCFFVVVVSLPSFFHIIIIIIPGPCISLYFLLLFFFPPSRRAMLYYIFIESLVRWQTL